MTTERDTGGRAFPWCGDLNETPTINLGMTLRDYFAGQAMQGLLSDAESIAVLKVAAVEDGIDVTKHIASSAYEMADAMLAARDLP